MSSVCSCHAKILGGMLTLTVICPITISIPHNQIHIYTYSHTHTHTHIIQAPKEKKEKAPKAEKPKEEKPKKEEKAPKKAAKEDDYEEEEEVVQEKKADHPFKILDKTNPTPFVMDTWKKTYSNCSDYHEV